MKATSDLMAAVNAAIDTYEASHAKPLRALIVERPIGWRIYRGVEVLTDAEVVRVGADERDAEIASLRADVERFRVALQKIDAIRNNIVGSQKVNWSRDMYPMVDALQEAGFSSLSYSDARARVVGYVQEIERLTKEVADLSRLGALQEAAIELEVALCNEHLPMIEAARARLRSLLPPERL